MSDFNILCDAFDQIGLKYNIRNDDHKRIVFINRHQDKVDFLGTGYAWFEFGPNGNFLKYYMEE